jgi:sigma-B regulation protein RsbU (phosphoserine phosphatase)
MVYAEVTDGNGTVRLVNAGHMPPVVLAPGGFHELPRGGIALGLVPSATYEEQTLDLRPGEMLFIYSDGLTEAMNEAGEFFDDARLRALFPHIQPLSPAEAGKRVIAEIERFIGNRRPYDDVSMVILRRRQGSGDGRQG